jgi:hypothetical protein
MSAESKSQGVIHGNQIELAAAPGLQDGQTVEVTVRPIARQGDPEFGQGLRRAAGALAGEWNDEDEAILREIEAARVRSVGRDLP